MQKAQQKRHDSLYRKYLSALKRQGKAPSTIDVYARAAQPTSRKAIPSSALTGCSRAFARCGVPDMTQQHIAEHYRERFVRQ